MNCLHLVTMVGHHSNYGSALNHTIYSWLKLKSTVQIKMGKKTANLVSKICWRLWCNHVMYFLFLSSKTQQSIQLPRSLSQKSQPEIRVGLNEQGRLSTCQANEHWHNPSNTQILTLTWPIKHPDIDINNTLQGTCTRPALEDICCSWAQTIESNTSFNC